MTLNVFSSFQDCDDVLRHPSSASDRLKSTAAQREIAEGVEARPIRPAGIPVPRPARPHPAAQAGQQGVRAEGGQGARTRHHRAGRFAARQGRPEQGSFDVIADLAYPLPVAVICRLLGVPIEDEPQFSRASALLAAALDPVISFTGQAARQFRRNAAGRPVAARVLAGTDRAQAQRSRRRSDVGADPRRGVGRSAHRGRDRRDVQPAAGRRQRDHYEPRRQRRIRAAAQPRGSSRPCVVDPDLLSPRRSKRRCATTGRCR